MVKRKTTEEFKQEVLNLVGKEYIVLSEYVNNRTKIKMKHNKDNCDYIYDVAPDKFLMGRRCPKCAGNIKKTTEEFKRKIHNLVGNEYSILEEYVDNRTSIKIKHNKEGCGHIYSVRPYSFLAGCRCPKCANNIKKTTEDFKKEIFDLVGDEYSVVGEYETNSIPIKIKHNKEGCGHIYSIRPYSFLAGCRCPKCANNIKKNTEYFKREVFNLAGNEYSVLGEYETNSIPIKMEHSIKNCGYKWNVTPHNFLKQNGTRCPKCNKGIKKTLEQFILEVYNLEGDEYSVLGDYINDSTGIKMRHNKEGCNHIWLPTPSNFLKGKRCPKCRTSKGELAIIKVLDMYKIEYITQYKSDKCKNINPLPFDFAVFKDSKLISLIEYDGIQHFKPIEAFGGKEHFVAVRSRDAIKNQYCKENNIPLLRIPYWEFNNISEILLKKLFKIKLI